jgi:hypothetical protein
MTGQTLYTNDECLGTETYVGTKEEFKSELAECFAEWFKQTNGEEGEDLGKWIDKQLDKHLNRADEDAIAIYPRITD